MPTSFTDIVAVRRTCADLSKTVEGLVLSRLWGLLHNEERSPIFGRNVRPLLGDAAALNAALGEAARTFKIEVLLMDAQYPARRLAELPKLPRGPLRQARPYVDDTLVVAAECIDIALISGGFHTTTWVWHVE